MNTHLPLYSVTTCFSWWFKNKPEQLGLQPQQYNGAEAQRNYQPINPRLNSNCNMLVTLQKHSDGGPFVLLLVQVMAV